MKILIMPSSLSNIDKFSKSDGFIVGLKGLSYFIPLEVNIDELKQLVIKCREKDKKIFVGLNKLMYNKDIPLLKEYLLIIEQMHIDGIMYDDLSIYNLSKKLKLTTPLIWFGIHSLTNYYSANYWYNKGIQGGVLSTEITLDHIGEIKSNTNFPLMMYGYGYLPMFVSSRSLISSYFKYIGKDKKDNIYNMYEETRRKSYPTYENENGTFILSSDIINTILELPIINNNVDYLILSSLNIPDDNFEKISNLYDDALSNLNDKETLKNISKLVDDNSISETDKGFLYKETVYRVKNDGEK